MSDLPPFEAPQAPLPLSFLDVGRLRVRPAEFARMVGVTRQTVSQWIQQGKVTLGVDGKLDPTTATREVVARSDPSRLRARVLKGAVEDGNALRRKIADLEAQLAAARDRCVFLEGFSDELEREADIFAGLVADRIANLAACGIDERRAQLAALRDRASILAGGYDPDAPAHVDDDCMTPLPTAWEGAAG